jgi:peptide/nickel transport system substrate-binding protein
MGSKDWRVVTPARSVVRSASAIALAIVCSLGVIGSAAGATRAESAVAGKKATGPFIVNMSLAPATIDPSEVSNAGDAGFISNFYVTLTQHGKKMGPNGYPQDDFTKVVPYLATKWRSSDGAKTWTFTLRKGAKFADGSAMDANAVKYSFDRMLTRASSGAAIGLNANNPTGFVQSVEAPNATTVVIRLQSPHPSYDDVLTYPADAIVNSKIVEANGGIDKTKPNAWMAAHAAGGGPYVLQSYDTSRGAVLTANPNFFGPKPAEKRVVVNFIPSDPTLLFQASAGKAHVTVGLQKQSTASLRGNSCCTIVENTFGQMVFFSLPNEHPPFNNKTFREGLRYAVPYAAIVKNVLYGYGKAYDGPFSPANSIFNAKLGKAHGYDVAKAKALIQQSGVTLPVNLDVYVRQGDNDHAQVAQVVQATWAKLGVNVTIKVVSATAFITARNAHPHTFSVIAGLGGTIPGQPAWDANYDSRCGHIFNTSDYCNQTVTSLIDQAFLAPKAKKQALYDRLTSLWLKDSPRINLYSPKYTVVVKKGVKYQYSQPPVHFWTWSR